MEYFTERAPTHKEALELVREKYGDQGVILTHRSVKAHGIKGLFGAEEVVVTGYLRAEPAPRAAAKPAPADAGLEEEKRKILEAARAGKENKEQPGTQEALGEVLKEIREIKSKIDEKPTPSPESQDHESIRRADELLALNDFSDGYRRAMVAKMRRDFTLEALNDWDGVESSLLNAIGDTISIYKEPETHGPRVIVLVGPTGVGKTTTIAKLAAIYRMGMGGEKPHSLRLINLDNYRIGARQQIETYGSIMGVPVSCAETVDDIRKILALHTDSDIVLVDTIGKSPRDSVRLGEMERLVSACGPQAEVHLAMAATTKTSDMAEILRQFEPFNYGSVILTKLDETSRVGNAISVLSEAHKSVSYLTTGQMVPRDIERASVPRLLIHLEGFQMNRGEIDDRYSDADAGGAAAAETADRKERR